MADRAAWQLSLLPMIQETFVRKLLEAVAEDGQATLGGCGGCAVHPLASSLLCAFLGKALWEIWQVFHSRLEITWCSSPGGPGNHFTEPLGPAEKGHAHTASVSGFGAGISMPGLEDRQSEQVILQKGEKKAMQPGKFLQHFQECLTPGSYF